MILDPARHIALTATVVVATAALGLVATAPVAAQDEAESKMRLSFPGDYVRKVESDRAIAVLGYRTANESLGDEWMLVEIAMTTQPGLEMTLKREGFSLKTPDGSVVPLASQKEFNEASGTLRALDRRANVQRESLAYLPPRADIPCRIGFFSDLANPQRGMTWDEFSMNSQSFCAGRLYFHVPGGIQYGRYFVEIDLPDGEMVLPMTIMTKDELKAAKAKVKEYEQQQKQAAKEQKKQAAEQR
ncbi:MAG: hypothetical protein MUE90_01780 [Thermoanaerobaculales bacterium]|jgi:hypothetical protein|nr:hypothetical protein [Thermoanaerobaculales bacterium]